MEEVLETYEQPYDPADPVVCMDEQPVQLIRVEELFKATSLRRRLQLNATGQPDSRSVLDRSPGIRQATARPQRTKVDWARAVAELLGHSVRRLCKSDAGLGQSEHPR